MDRSYTNFFPEEEFPQKRKNTGRRIAGVIAVILAAAFLIGLGIGAYAILKPPALGRAAANTVNDLADTDSLAAFFEALAEGSREAGAEVTLEGKVPAELTGGEGLTFALEA